MKPLSYLATLAVLICFLSGCWLKPSSSTSAFTIGGISFTVQDAGGTSSSKTTSSTGRDGTSQTTHQLHLGDLTIDLGEEVDGAMPMTVDGKPYGTLQKGDAVVIDADRTITVNGQVRTSE